VPIIRTDAKADTKSRILDTALALFNERGTANVTTNHISEALNMSPGNLYYHFRNKAAIVREIFVRIMQAWAENYALPEGTPPTSRLWSRWPPAISQSSGSTASSFAT